MTLHEALWAAFGIGGFTVMFYILGLGMERDEDGN